MRQQALTLARIRAVMRAAVVTVLAVYTLGFGADTLGISGSLPYTDDRWPTGLIAGFPGFVETAAWLRDAQWRLYSNVTINGLGIVALLWWRVSRRPGLVLGAYLVLGALVIGQDVASFGILAAYWDSIFKTALADPRRFTPIETATYEWDGGVVLDYATQYAPLLLLALTTACGAFRREATRSRGFPVAEVKAYDATLGQG